MRSNLIQMPLPDAEVADFCRRHRIKKFAVFGSVLRADFRPDSDLDVLVEFEVGHVPGLIRLAAMELELSKIVGGRKVDMNTRLTLGRFFREQVTAEAETIYVAR